MGISYPLSSCFTSSSSPLSKLYCHQFRRSRRRRRRLLEAQKSYIMPQSLVRLPKPVYISSRVVHGFGRGSKTLGVPTANLEENVVEQVKLDPGIYYGFAQLIHPPDSDLPKLTESHSTVTFATNQNNPIYPAVFSLGWNPHFDDVTKRTLEAHLLHTFEYDFYGSQIRIAICGYIRPERKFDSLQELIDTINDDIMFAKNALKNPETDWKDVVHNPFFHVSQNRSNEQQ